MRASPVPCSRWFLQGSSLEPGIDRQAQPQGEKLALGSGTKALFPVTMTTATVALRLPWPAVGVHTCLPKDMPSSAGALWVLTSPFATDLLVGAWCQVRMCHRRLGSGWLAPFHDLITVSDMCAHSRLREPAGTKTVVFGALPAHYNGAQPLQSMERTALA